MTESEQLTNFNELTRNSIIVNRMSQLKFFSDMIIFQAAKT